MRRLLSRLPGPMPVKVVTLIVLVVVALIALGLLFEWAGAMLDDGGTIGT